jgi:hypothetical protein
MLHRDAEALIALKQRWAARQDVERCELCAKPLEGEHPHLVDTVARRIVCSCGTCAMLFERQGTSRYRRIPRDIIQFEDFVMNDADADWNALGIPIGLAFFFFSSPAGKVIAMYPSPAGATEAVLSDPAWNEIAQRHPRLQQLQPDVEALLVNRLQAPAQSYIVPIDRCYELTGTIRKHWSGFSGGEELWQKVDQFFQRLDQQSIRIGVEHARSAV